MPIDRNDDGPASLNDPGAAPYVRNPLLAVLFNGKPIPGALSATWSSTNHFAPDTFTASFALNADARFGLDWWEGLDVPAFVDIQVDTGAGPFSLGIGQVDQHQASPEEGTFTISGRDLGALMLDTPTAEAFQNQTSSQIVETIAQRHGLTPKVTGTTTLADRFFTTDHTRETHATGSRNTNEWDLLVRLAQQDGFDLFMTGRTLNYQPLPKVGDKPYLVRWQNRTAGNAVPLSNAIGLHLDRKLQLAKPVTVTVSSFHSKKGATVTATASTTGAKTGGVISGSVFTQSAKKPQKYNFSFPNLTQAQAQARADVLLADITKHERSISWQEPANNLISPRNVVRVEGVGQGWDQSYFVETVTRHIDFGGFKMDIKAKNQSAATSAIIQGGQTA